MKKKSQTVLGKGHKINQNMKQVFPLKKFKFNFYNFD